ncbi:hypothetical protein BCR34DRAFT_630871 [Clohesyomyces aquaticus]|uniref:Rhodopsin domain-containing protein n=1 Tax=Clohesyomyces aquaticus TaxID=1231657 RepID=A0A1Y1ZDP1_9PLEO|nr:hypothetical protein BCR34DRAFT_630871 [Clohesyomyces aquaticus]
MSTNKAARAGESQTSLIYSLSIVFVTLSTISVGLRLYTRGVLLKTLGTDDLVITVAQFLAIAVSIATCLEAFWGLGRHTEFVPAESVPKQLKALYVVIMTYNAAQTITKISFLIQYRRLFPSPTTQRVCFWFLVFIIAWGVTQEFLLALSCIPLSIIAPNMVGKCIYTLPIWYLTSSMNIATDFMIFSVPVPPVLKLQMRSKQKIMLCGLFGLGFFTCLISVVRLFTLHKAVDTKDPMWDNAPAAYWTVVELNCGIICACLPTLRALIAKYVPKVLSTRYHNTSSGGTRVTVGLSTMHKRSRGDKDNGIYVQKDIEVHSTTELRSNAAVYPVSLEEGSQHGSAHAIAHSNGAT